MPRRPSRFMRFVRNPSNRLPVVAVVVVTLLLLVSVANLVVVSQGTIRIAPEQHEGVQWSLGRDATGTEADQRLEWIFSVDPGRERNVEIDLEVPLQVTITHDEGEAVLSMLVIVYLDGTERLGRNSDSISAGSSDAGTQRTEHHDLAPEGGPVVVNRDPDAGPFVLLVTLDWGVVPNDPPTTRFDIEVGPVAAQPHRLNGIPGCTGTDCARILFIVILVAQGAATFWVMQRRKPASQTKHPTTRAKAPGPQAHPGRHRETDKKK